MAGGWAALAQIAGQLIDSWSNRQAANRAPRLAGRTARSENREGLIGRLEGAQAMGIHPALALGSNISGSGAPLPVGSDFASAFGNAAEHATRQREWKAEQEFRRLQQTADERRDAEQAQRDASQRAVNDAQIRNMDKQSEFIDEQIKASQEQRIREANRASAQSASGPHDMHTVIRGRRGRYAVDNSNRDVVYVPNEVTRSNSAGTAAGNNPGYETIMIGGRPVKVPFGSTQNHEPSEIFSMFRELDAATEPGGYLNQKWQDLKAWLKRQSYRAPQRGPYRKPKRGN